MQRIGQRKGIKQATSILSTPNKCSNSSSVKKSFGGIIPQTQQRAFQQKYNEYLISSLPNLLRLNKNGNIVSLQTSSIMREFHTNYRNYKKDEKVRFADKL